jgi:hypothetical protein
MTPELKLTKKQKEIISLMQNGWELGVQTGRMVRTSLPLSDKYYLQQGGLGKGGKTKRIAYVSFLKLLNSGFITPTYNRISSSLTELGKSLKLD